MRNRPAIARTALLALLAAALAPSTAGAAPPARALLQTRSAAAVASNQLAATPTSETIQFDVGLQLKDQSGAEALGQEVSDPSSARYRHYLTPAQWESRFSPTQASVSAVTAWLRGEGVAVEAVTPDRMTVQASAPASVVERAFGVGLAEYRNAGRVVRLASGSLTIPASLAGLVTGVTGVDETVATHDDLTGAATARPTTTRAAVPAGKEPIPQPEGFRNAPPCSRSYAGKLDTTDPAYGGGFPNRLPYAVCGYRPVQLQGAYGLAPAIAGGIDGKGVTVAVVDAYASPTLLSDAQEYASKNQPGEPLEASQFSELLSPRFNEIELCEASGWYGEQTLDVEAVHAMAPGANILYVGAKNCLGALFNSVQQVVDGHLASVVTDSWGDNGGDLLDSAATRRSFDHVLMMAAGTGVGVQFSSGDNGAEFTTIGATVADYPPSSPYATAVGGTSLQIGSHGARLGELGWSTSKSVLCTSTLAELEYPGCSSSTLSTWLPPAPGAYDYGGGGGTSYEYPEPSYQEGVVPPALAHRNTAITKIANRVEPDISMEADPSTGMLIGETQTFPDGVHYGQYRIGGTSLASPLFAGVMADADQAAGGSLGFVNPLLYKLESSPSLAASAFYDVVPGGNQAVVRNDYLDGINAREGILTSVRVLDYQGLEQFCSGTGNCTVQDVALETAPGFDSMTGIGSPGAGFLAAVSAPAAP